MPKCSECGYLAVRNGVTREFETADSRRRLDGDIPSGQNLDPFPVCAAHSKSFPTVNRDANNKNNEILRIINQNNDCGQRIEWWPWLSPKEHAEKMFQITLLELQKQQQERDQAWRERQADRELAWRESQAERERKWRAEDRSLAMFNLFVAAGAGIATVVAALIASKLLAVADQSMTAKFLALVPFPQRGSVPRQARRNPVGVEASLPLFPQGCRDAWQPWAMRRNSFGVKTRTTRSVKNLSAATRIQTRLNR